MDLNSTALLSPNYLFDIPFERDFKPEEQLKWMESHWQDSIYWCSAYVLLIFGGKVSVPQNLFVLIQF